jgi:hypothetical protein
MTTVLKRLTDAGVVPGIIGQFGQLPGNEDRTGNDSTETGSSVSTVRFADTYKKVKLPDSNGIVFLVAKGSNVYDMSQLVQSITWSGAKSAMPRTLEVTMLDSDQHGKIRPDIDVDAGQQCLFMYNGQELFRGIFFSSSQTASRTATYVAYDAGIYLAKNMDTFVFKKKTATQIFQAICKRFGMEHTEVNTGYTIGDLTMQNVTAADAIWNALAKTYKAKGTRYYVWCEKGVMKLISRADNVIKIVLEEGANTIDFTRERSLENVYTRVKLYSDENKVLGSAKDTSIEAKIGVMQYAESGDKEKAAQMQAKAKNLLSIKKKSEETLEVEMIGDATIHSGVAVYVNLPYLGLKQTYFVDEDEHTFTKSSHTMTLKLNAVNEPYIDESTEDDE